MATTVSIIVPVRNEADSTGVLLEDFLGQIRPGEEILVVDIGSGDATVPRVLEFVHTHSTIRLLYAPGTYPGGGRNMGFRAARYEWVAFVDARIRMERDWLSRPLAPVDRCAASVQWLRAVNSNQHFTNI